MSRGNREVFPELAELSQTHRRSGWKEKHLTLKAMKMNLTSLCGPKNWQEGEADTCILLLCMCAHSMCMCVCCYAYMGLVSMCLLQTIIWSNLSHIAAVLTAKGKLTPPQYNILMFYMFRLWHGRVVFFTFSKKKLTSLLVLRTSSLSTHLPATDKAFRLNFHTYFTQ